MPAHADTIYQALCGVLVSTFAIPLREIRPTATIGDLDLDSLALAELAVILSENIGITVTEDGITAEHSLSDFAEHISASALRRSA
ncbi:acyl carrier protein [Streptomyces sp. NPDC055085]